MAKSVTYAVLKEFARRANDDRYDAKGESFITEAIEEALKVAGSEKWSWLVKRTRVTTSQELSTKGYVNLTANASKVIFASGITCLTQAGVNNQWAAKFEGDDVDYDIASTAAGSTVSLTSIYVRQSNVSVSGVSYRLFRRTYDLPDDFRELVAIVHTRQPHMPLARKSLEAMLTLNLQRTNGDTPDSYSVENKSGDMKRQLWLFPYPSGNTRHQFDLIYYRWPTKPTADADIIDWPDDLIPLLRDAIEMEIAKKNNDDQRYQLKLADYNAKKIEAIGSDVEDGGQFYIGVPSVNTRRAWPLHLTVNP